MLMHEASRVWDWVQCTVRFAAAGARRWQLQPLRAMDHTSTSEQTLPRRCARVARAVLSRRLPIAARRPPLHELLRVRVREPHLLLRCEYDEYEYEYDSVCSMIAKRSSATVGTVFTVCCFVQYSHVQYCTEYCSLLAMYCTCIR